jgi:outer membrane protein OmpA-like peptidoglycan-associated protein
MVEVGKQGIVAVAVLAAAFVALTPAPSRAQATWDDTSKINQWFDKQKGRTYDMQAPGAMQNAGKIQQAGQIEVPKGWQAIKTVKLDCREKLIVCADTLFEFDKATLTPDAEATLKLLGPKILSYGPHPVFIDGHTDSKGDDQYNQELSVRRAERVKNWLMMNHFVGKDALVQGWGKKKPIAPNTKPDGKDNPQGRQANRRVEIVIDTCKKLEAAGATPPSAVPSADASSAPAAGTTAPAAGTATTTGTTAEPSSVPSGAEASSPAPQNQTGTDPH